MISDLEFLNEMTALLETENHVSVSEATPRTPIEVNFQQSWATISTQHDHVKIDNNEGEKPSTRKSKRHSKNPDPRRKKYRLKAKSQLDELRQTADEFSTKLQELLHARNGAHTTARTDLVLSTTFWKQIATQQHEQRLLAEAERKNLLAIVNSQGSYIESMRNVPHAYAEESSALALVAPNRDSLCGVATIHDTIDDLKWLRLKSSVASVYTTYLQEVGISYARIDQVFRDAEMECLPIGKVDGCYKYKPTGELKYFQHRNRLLQPFGFQAACLTMWELSTVAHRQNDRYVYCDVSDPENTKAVQFRLRKTLDKCSPVSILKHVVSRRFTEKDRVVIVWKVFSEGEGIFSGMDTDETAWVSIRPLNDGSKKTTLMEFCSRQVPVPYLTANAHDPAVKEFQKMMEDAVAEDAQIVASKLQKASQRALYIPWHLSSVVKSQRTEITEENVS
ncbi:hypothetical protein L917_12847 [Phytophthora nicotianae]|uniref:START domain-containing protein n=1 Tax=Phytophthora nicotianae TaxID=4792 RepID=W2KTY1_PHYNI|nr:hypothetical protein L917_12847 [Phytophthora nicotianae]